MIVMCAASDYAAGLSLEVFWQGALRSSPARKPAVHAVLNMKQHVGVLISFVSLVFLFVLKVFLWGPTLSCLRLEGSARNGLWVAMLQPQTVSHVS